MIVDGNAPQAIAQAANTLAAGELVAFPTETVYGLGADAENDDAIANIFAAKGRPSDHPLIVHIANASLVVYFASSVPPFAHALMNAFWPGPLTLILPRRAGVAQASAGGQDSIGLRCPAHPVAQALLHACLNLSSGPVRGLAAPSANQFGRVSPTSAQHVLAEFAPQLLVLDGGACPVGIESAIVDCTRARPVLLRPGMLTAAQLERAAGVPVVPAKAYDPTAPRASGTLEAHYAPRAKLRLMDADALQSALDLLGKDGKAIAVYSRAILRCASAAVLCRRMPDDAGEVARQLFAVLREFDAAGVKLIWVEVPPDLPEWAGVRDRLQRAAAA